MDSGVVPFKLLSFHSLSFFFAYLKHIHLWILNLLQTPSCVKTPFYQVCVDGVLYGVAVSRLCWWDSILSSHVSIYIYIVSHNVYFQCCGW